MTNLLTYVIIWYIIPLINFFVWLYIAQNGNPNHCEESTIISNGLLSLPARIEEVLCPKLHEFDLNAKHSSCNINIDKTYQPTLERYSTLEFDKYRAERLAPMQYTLDSDTYILKRSPSDNCVNIEHQYTPDDDGNCFAIIYTDSLPKNGYNIVRFDSRISEEGLDISWVDPGYKRNPDNKYYFFPNEHNANILRPAGFFRKVPKGKGRNRLREKLTSFLTNLDILQNDVKVKLENNNIKTGDDLIVMVVNEGEIDLYLNFACSCQQHNINLKNLLVFSASP